MGDAYECDRCGTLNSGNGAHMRVGEALLPSRGIGTSYDWIYARELCPDCRDEFEQMVVEFFDEGKDNAPEATE
jgi:hypothetical protein